MKLVHVTCLALGFAGVRFASGQAMNLNLDFEQINAQNASSTTTLNFYAAEEQVQLAAPGNPMGTTVTRPNGTVDVLNPFFTQEFLDSNTYANFASFSHDWGLGNYTFNGTPGSLAAVVPNSAYMWAQTPQVTNYSSLQGLSPVTGGEVTLSPFAQDPNATSTSESIYVYDLTSGDTVFSQQYSTPVTSFELTPDMLQQSQQYAINIEYMNVLSLSPVAGFQGATPNITFNVVTNASFFTAVPEPAPIAMMALGLIGLAVRRPKRSINLLRLPH